MSAKFNITVLRPRTSKTYVFNVEITEDGDLMFTDYDIEYDVSMVEFGEEETVAVMLLGEWKARPLNFIVTMLGVTKKSLSKLASDFADHALSYFDEDLTKSILPAIAKKARSGHSASALFNVAISAAAQEAHDAEWEAGTSSEHDRKQQAVFAAQRNAISSKIAAESTKTMQKDLDREFILAAEFAQRSPGWLARSEAKNVSANELVDIFNEAAFKEQLWQIRRFVHCMAAVLSDNPWPPLEATP